jgi:RES domain-containing protein
MIVYRCTLRRWASDLSGAGAFLYGGRWNSPGTYLIYSAENNVLAAFEVALRVPLDHISKNYVMVPIEIPDNVKIIKPSLPRQWQVNHDVTRAMGVDFVKERISPVMKVPSALISDSFNYLINPLHPLLRNVKVREARPILFDKRLREMIRGK